MSLVEHLRELRNRLAIGFGAITVCAIGSLIRYDDVFNFITKPYCSASRQIELANCQLYNLAVLDQMQVFLRVGFISGIVLSSPIWLYQVGAFIVPGLHPKERRLAGGFAFGAMILFLVGCAFAYLTLSKGLAFLLSIGGDQITPLLSVSSYLNYVVLMLLAFGVAFEFPAVVLLLNLVGILSLQRMRAWRRGVIFGIAVFTAVITPSQDPFTFAAMAVPLAVMYEGCILIARVRERAARRRALAEGTSWEDIPLDEASPLDLTPSPLPDADPVER